MRDGRGPIGIIVARDDNVLTPRNCHGEPSRSLLEVGQDRERGRGLLSRGKGAGVQFARRTDPGEHGVEVGR
ncbi:MAG TPA: hypothetical protein VMV40_10170 [Acidiferrobacter sp.]|nr:hypothetical protein [Acidiferrobacter sp.]